MRRAWNRAKRGTTRFWQGFREWCGDSAYERYRECSLRTGVGKPLTPSEFYVEQLNRKYSRPSRCC